MGNQNVVSNVPTLDKSILKGSYKFIHERFKSRHQNFKNNLIGDITKTNGSKMIYLLRKIGFGDESTISLVKGFENSTKVEECMDKIENILPN